MSALQTQIGVARAKHSRHLFIAGFVLTMVVLVAALLYLAAGLTAANRSAPVMPLDDTYIHFQYARAFAEGHPFRYNPDQPPTSGATSLLYPVVLALGYRIGFTGEALSWWALGIGILCWIGSAWLVYRLGAFLSEGLSWIHWIGLVVAAAFALTGSLSWAFMSGMETGPMVLLTLLTLWYVVRGDRRGVALSGAVVTLLRPEGALIGILAVVYLVASEPSIRAIIRQIPLYILPFIAFLIQPLLNLALTGSTISSGMQAKSYLYNVPPNLNVMIANIANVFARMWAELLIGYSPDTGWYVAPGFLFLWIPVIVVGVYLFVRKRVRNPALVAFGWMLALTLGLATLETAFWQFKRYQQPIIALMFPLAAWGLNALWARRRDARSTRIVVLSIPALLLLFSLVTTVIFVKNYADNVHEIAFSQIPMARFVAETTAPTAIIAVHDIGVMRYLGNRTTYDVVGLTTPGAARPWRNGPGSLYEQMAINQWRPDYFALYPDARGLNYLVDTKYLLGEKLGTFPSTNPEINVASATFSGQIVAKANWTYASFAPQHTQPSWLSVVDGMKLADTLNVADLASENAHDYRWWEAAQRPGFATEIYEQNYTACQPLPQNPTCIVSDGGRLITGGEEMTIATTPKQDLIWITRIHPRNAATLTIMLDGKRVATRIIPSIPGQWIEIATLIPADLITATRSRLRVEANIADPAAGHYMPYYHWFYQGTYRANTSATLPGPGATFSPSVMLSGRQVTYNPATRTVKVDLEWQLGSHADPGTLSDAKLFVHLYTQDDQFIKDVQIDSRPGGGALPLANLLPGVLRDSYTLTLPESVLPGTYRVVIGLYNPVTGERWPITGDGVASEQRLIIGTIEVGEVF
jgi:hypothetical protein